MNADIEADGAAAPFDFQRQDPKGEGQV